MSTERFTVSRRSMLGLIGAAGAAASTSALAGCSGSGQSDKLVVATVKETGAIDSDKYYKEQLAKFTDQTGIEVDFRSYPFDQYGNSVQLLFSQGQAPDVFRSAGTSISHPIPYVRGWEHPLNDLVTQEYKDRWPAGSFNPKISGLHVGDELYGVPFAAGGAVYPLYCNMEVLDKYGISKPPETWSEFADAAAKITKDSKGEVHGLYPLDYTWKALAATGGPDISLGPSGVSLATGKSAAASPQQVQVMELLQQMNSDGSFIPGWNSEQAQAGEAMWTPFVQNEVGMAFGSNWYYREMLRAREDVQLVMAPPPVPDSGRAGYQGYKFIFLPFWHMGARTQSPENAWKLLEFLSSKEVMLGYYSIARRNPPALPKSAFADQLDEWDEQMFDLKDEAMRSGPAATMHSIDAAAVESEINAHQPEPPFADLQTLAVSRPGKFDYEQEAEKWDAENEENISTQIDQASQDGKDISRETFTFTDWDPMQDYLPPGVDEMPDWS